MTSRRFDAGGGSCAAVLLTAITLLAHPATSHGADGIPWRTEAARQLTPAPMGPVAAAVELDRLATDGERHAVVQFAGPLAERDRAILASAGVTILAPLGRSSFFVGLSPDGLDAAAVARLGALELASSVERPMRLHAALLDLSTDPNTGIYNSVPDWSVAYGVPWPTRAEVTDIVAVYVMLHRDVDLDDAIEMAVEREATIVSRIDTINTLVLELPADRLHDVADLDAVQWIEPPLPPLTELNDSNRVATEADVVQQGLYDLDGSGVVVMVYDGGFALASHTAFDGRLTVRDSAGLSDHATHVAGTIGGNGDGSTNNMHRGMAPNCTLESYGFEQAGGLQQGFLYTDPGDLADDYADAINNFGAVISNNSIGTNTASNGFPCEWEGDYGVTSNLIDSVVRGDLGAPIRIVWANGNERGGSANCGSGYHTTAPPACAKNHLTVGAMNSNDDSVTGFTSFGPADDGRMKPDISAPGCQSNGDGGVTSCSSSGGYNVKCGTSMAAPTAAGCAALLLQDFRIQYPTRPDYLPSTQKVLLIHNAMDLENTGPDYQTGYGMIQIQDTIDFMRTGNFLEGEVTQGETYTFTLEVPGAVSEAKVSLAWDDAPGTPNVDPALVNDLDLVVTGPGGTHYPWTLDDANPGDPAVRTGANRLDNIEQVVIDNPTPGTYTVEVIGFDVPEGPQSFSVAASPEMIATSIDLAAAAPTLIAPETPEVIQANIIAINETIVAGSPTLHYRHNGGSFSEVTMSLVSGDLWEATLPGAGCDDDVEFYVSVQGSDSGLNTNPTNAPAVTYQPAIGEVFPVFADNFEADMGWTVTNGGGLADGAWTRGVPAGDGDRGDPTQDADGSGQCYLTDNVAGNSDVDDGFTTVTSPTMDASQGTPVVAYYRWYSNVAGNAPNEDIFEVEVSDNDGGTWVDLETVGPAGPGTAGGWVYVEHDLTQLGGFALTDQFRIRFTASDLGDGSVVEAGVDGVTLVSIDCIEPKNPCIADVADPQDDVVNVTDLLAMLAAWGSSDANFDIAPEGGDGTVDIQDLLLLLSLWGPCP